jgi:hypothetical protein
MLITKKKKKKKKKKKIATITTKYNAEKFIGLHRYYSTGDLGNYAFLF